LIYDQAAYPASGLDPVVDQYLARVSDTVPDLPPYRDPGKESLDHYAGYDDFRAASPWQPEAAWPERPVSDESWPPQSPRGPIRRIITGGRPAWSVVGLIAVAVAGLGFAAVIATGRTNHPLPSSALPGGTVAPGARPPAMRPPITQAQAQQVLAAYTSTNNMANAQADRAWLATVETGSSLAIDAGIDQAKKASGSAPYPAYGPAHASYYIPLEPSDGYPRWFAVQVQNAFASAPGQVVNSEYLVFTQGTPGAPWKDAIEPFILPGATPPQVAIDAHGYATAVTANDAGLALPPATVGEATATALDNGAGEPASPGNLADQLALADLSREFRATSSETDRHSAAAEPVFGLRTIGGGALLFYDVAAQVTVTAQAGGTLSLNVPGFLPPGNQAAQATLDYLEQFAAYDPPAAGAGQATQEPAPPVVADYSGITGASGG